MRRASPTALVVAGLVEVAELGPRPAVGVAGLVGWRGTERPSSSSSLRKRSGVRSLPSSATQGRNSSPATVPLILPATGETAGLAVGVTEGSATK